MPESFSSPDRAPCLAGHRRGREPEPCRREAPRADFGILTPPKAGGRANLRPPRRTHRQTHSSGRRTEWMPPSEDDGPLRRDASAALVPPGRFGGYVSGRSFSRTGVRAVRGLLAQSLRRLHQTATSTEARKGASHAHAVGGTKPGITDPTSEAPGQGSPAPCRGSAATGRRGRSAIPLRCGRRGRPPCR